jgi:hypothetical protein
MSQVEPIGPKMIINYRARGRSVSGNNEVAENFNSMAQLEKARKSAQASVMRDGCRTADNTEQISPGRANWHVVKQVGVPMGYPPRTECHVLGYAVDAMPSSRQMSTPRCVRRREQLQFRRRQRQADRHCLAPSPVSSRAVGPCAALADHSGETRLSAMPWSSIIPGMTDRLRFPELCVPAASRRPALILRPWRAADIPALAPR